MKFIFQKGMIPFLLCLIILDFAKAQSTDPLKSDPTYSKRKENYYSSVKGFKSNAESIKKLNSLDRYGSEGCFILRDSSYIKADMSNEDDGSYGPVSLPFTFNLYGQNYNQVWINNNGNLSFNSSFSSYIASGFPINQTPMIAGFWGDVDTRNSASGKVYYKIYPTRLVVTWDHVGYYNQNGDLLNTFQIIIGTFGDSILGAQSNVKLNYQDIQWASSGGFGGNPSTVGINAGDGTNYVQVGRFSFNNSSYDGPGGQYDGINFLDNQCFSFDATSSGNIPPSVSNLDFTTATLNVGDTVSLEPQFIGPEVDQTVISTVDAGGMCKVQDSITNGYVSVARLKIKADTCNIGTHVIAITATDNGSPTKSTTIRVTINVNKLNQNLIFNAIPNIIYGSSPFQLHATASSGLPVTYSVISGPASVSGGILTPTGVGTVTVRAQQAGNSIYNPSLSVDQSFCIKPNQPSNISGPSEACPNAQYTYSVNPVTGATFTWTATGQATIIQTGNIAKITFADTGLHTISVKYSSNCDTAGPAQTLSMEVSNQPLTGSITKMLPADNSANLFFPILFSWSPIQNATNYDLYIWPSSANRPAISFKSNISQISYTVNYGLKYDTLYKWQVIAKKACDSIESNVQTFKLRSLPDLVVTNVSTPVTASSESQITIKWTIKNQGTGNTDNTWTDAVYISDLPQFDNLSAKLIGQVHNISALDSGQTYTNAQGIQYYIPIGTQGTKYFFVRTNAGNGLLESTDTNNIKASDSVNITLAPPPNLKVTALSLNPSSNIIAGSNLKISFTVKNEGTGPTSASSWIDKIYFSDSVILNQNKATLLASVSHNGKLQNTGMYVDSVNVPIPLNVFGQYYIHVYTDASEQVYEFLQENDNITTSNPLTVFLNPSSNLTVSNVSTEADSLTNGQPVTVQWTEKNQGTASVEPTWYNSIYLSTDTILITSSDILIGSIARSEELIQQNSLSGILNTNIPSSLQSGQYYIFVLTDPQNYVFEYDATVPDAEKDNSSRSLNRITVVNPDLKATLIKNQDTAYSKDTINISWQVDNISKASVYNGNWNDKIFLSADTILDASDILLNTVQFSNTFITNNSNYYKNQSITLPRGISGSKYLILSVDNSNDIKEMSEVNNKVHNKLYIKLAPYADLTVTAVEAPAIDTVGKLLNINYTVKNTSKKIAAQSWIDNIYLSPTNNLSETNLILLGSVVHSSPLNPAASYQQNVSFTIPVSIDAKTYYPLVFIDAANAVYEYTSENNNKNIGDSIVIKPLPSIDLAIDSAYTAKPDIMAGARIPITWNVINNGPGETIVPSWQDAIYMSSDTIKSSGDKLLLVSPVQKILKEGETYSITQSVSIPQDVSGSQYLLVTTDYANEIKDNNRINNTKVISIKSAGGGGTGGIGDTIVITQPIPSDLIIDTLQIPAEGTASQPINISYTVKNSGLGTTQSNSWKDKIYLSTDFVVSSDDILLASFNRNDSLRADSSYTGTKQIFLPANANGNYIVLLEADADNQVYEKNGETNNEAYASFFIKPQLPCDLMADSVKSLASVIIDGEPSTFQWKLFNAGDNPATGYTREAIYLSKDSAWDDSDALIGYMDDNIDILPETAITRQITASANVAPGTYYPVIKTDILNNLVETNEGNNTGVALTPVTVDVKQLHLNITSTDTLETGAPVYYRLQVADSLTGKTLSVTLKGDSANNAVNRLFISHDTLPSENNYQFTAQESFKANQQALVPSMIPGNYYITASGISSQAKPKQPITLLAQTIPFSILSVNANHGGNTGFVTVKLSGAKFEPGMLVKLIGDSTTIAAGHITFINSVTAFATFDLANQPLGIYTVLGINGINDTAKLTNGFEIVQGSAGGTGIGGNGFTCSIQNIDYENNFELTNETLPTARANTTAVITILFQNTGNVDIPVQHLVFTSPDSVYINFQSAYTDKLNELLLDCKEDDGPDNILRPGATGYIKIYALIKGGPHEIIYFTIQQ